VALAVTLLTLGMPQVLVAIGFELALNGSIAI
jgi:hypothetical protein